MGGPGTVGEDDVMACVGDSADLALDDLVYAVGDGDAATLRRVYGRLMAEGTSPISVLTAVARHLMRLHETRGHINAGKNAKQAIFSLRPPVFGRLTDRFAAQAGRWKEDLLARGVSILNEAEMGAKSTDMPAEAIVERALLQLANAAARAARS
jgi:DNA polymerase-3 subunit delta